MGSALGAPTTMETLSLAARDVNGFEVAALDTLQFGLAGDTERSHPSLGYLTPTAFAAKIKEHDTVPT
jgi:transposase InsO family protein